MADERPLWGSAESELGGWLGLLPERQLRVVFRQSAFDFDFEEADGGRRTTSPAQGQR
jgi:hypothetical protein